VVGQGAVAELVPDPVDRLAFPGEFGRVGVTEPVGVDPFLAPGLGGKAGEELPDIARVEGRAGQGAEQPPP